MLTDIVVKKLAPYVKRCDPYRADKHTYTDIHTAKKLRKVYFTFFVVLFYILLGSKIGGFQFILGVSIS